MFYCSTQRKLYRPDVPTERKHPFVFSTNQTSLRDVFVKRTSSLQLFRNLNRDRF